ncbi:uncharacterized protein LOC123683213 [Harmonia axyridis]|uniref:uncharacterized protein LOC123683213 n=1 Tax=Harmonia axyridis TaxID=115357 RepID=UPI001E275B3A|nr:uncharacterized protein LOC123683213 [Harmonia axyridis]
MTENYSTSSDYVDIHGQKLNVLIKSDGAKFIPLHEIRKTGFHIFPEADYNRASVGKKVLLDELRLYLLGAAKEFVIQRNIRSINHEEIYKTIDECHDKLSNNGPTQQSSSGVLGRRLLSDPAEFRKGQIPMNQSVLNSSKFENVGGMLQNNKTTNFSNSDSANLRLPHTQNGYFNPNNLDIGDSTKAHSNYPNKMNFPNKSNWNQRNKTNPSKNLNENNSSHSKKTALKTNCESISTSESEDVGQHFVRLSALKLERIKLLPVMQEVKVVYVESNKEKLKYWVQFVENDKIIMDIMGKCYDLADDAPVVKPKLNEIYLVMNKDDELWYRAIVVKVQPTIKVHFIDYGNDAFVSEVRTIPDELKTIPAQAVRICLSRPEGANQPTLEMDEIISVKLIKQFDDTTNLVLSANKKTATAKLQSPSEPIILGDIKYTQEWVHKDVVKIVAHSGGKLYLRNKEHHGKLVEVDMEINNWTRELVKDVVLGQVVLCKKEGSEEKLCRAKIENVENPFATVHYIDYHKNDKVLIKNLYVANKRIANLPATLIESPTIKEFISNKFDSNAASMLDEMITNNVKFTVAASGSEFDLFLKDKSLSELIYPNTCKIQSTQQLNKVSTGNVQEESKSKYIKVLFEDMKSYEVPMGKGDYMLTNFKDATDFTVTCTEDKESDLLSRCTCIEVTDTDPYEPDDSEMVLGYFEGGWYRALVLEKSDNGIYQVLFVEYGNILEITKNEIRRFPAEFKDIPFLGLSCKLNVANTEKVRLRLEELLEPDNIYEINFISYSLDTLQYTVDIPKITEILKKEGLM